MKHCWITITAFLMVFAFSCSVSSIGYADNGKGNQGKKPKHAVQHQAKGNKNFKNRHNDAAIDAASILISAGISYLEARRFAEGSQAVGYSALPPGIQKNLLRGKPLPPGIAKKMVPSSMLGKLPHHPGYIWGVAGTDLILIHAATHVVADILHDVFK